MYIYITVCYFTRL